MIVIPWKYDTLDGVPGTLVCTMPVTDYARSDDDQLVPSTPRECGSEVYVTWSFSVPVFPGPCTKADVPSSAVASTWEATCTNGHTLAVSSMTAVHAEDDAEPFDPAIVFGVTP